LSGGTVWLDERGLVKADVVIADGRIVEVAEAGKSSSGERVDVSGLLVMQGAVDAHIHLGHGNDISRPRVAMDATTETAAAASGGVTCVIPYMLSAEPYAPVFDEIRAVTEAGARIDFGFHFVIATEDQLAEVPMLCRLGSATAKLFMNIRGDEGKRLGLPGNDDGFLFRQLEVLAADGVMLCPHP
jgi:dihydropyrimidinase